MPVGAGRAGGRHEREARSRAEAGQRFHLPAHTHCPVYFLHLWLLSLRLARVPTSASTASWIRPSPSSARRLASATTSPERASKRQNQSSSSGAKNERRTRIGVPSRRNCAAEVRARAAAAA